MANSSSKQNSIGNSQKVQQQGKRVRQINGAEQKSAGARRRQQSNRGKSQPSSAAAQASPSQSQTQSGSSTNSSPASRRRTVKGKPPSLVIEGTPNGTITMWDDGGIRISKRERQSINQGFNGQ